MKNKLSAFPTVVSATVVAYLALEVFTYVVPWVQIFILNIDDSPLIDFIRLTVESICIVTVSSLTARYLYRGNEPIIYALGPTIFMFYMIVGYGHELFKMTSLLELVATFYLGYKIPSWYEGYIK